MNSDNSTGNVNQKETIDTASTLLRELDERLEEIKRKNLKFKQGLFRLQKPIGEMAVSSDKIDQTMNNMRVTMLMTHIMSSMRQLYRLIYVLK